VPWPPHWADDTNPDISVGVWPGKSWSRFRVPMPCVNSADSRPFILCLGNFGEGKVSCFMKIIHNIVGSLLARLEVCFRRFDGPWMYLGWSLRRNSSKFPVSNQSLSLCVPSGFCDEDCVSCMTLSQWMCGELCAVEYRHLLEARPTWHSRHTVRFSFLHCLNSILHRTYFPDGLLLHHCCNKIQIIFEVMVVLPSGFVVSEALKAIVRVPAPADMLNVLVGDSSAPNLDMVALCRPYESPNRLTFVWFWSGVTTWLRVAIIPRLSKAPEAATVSTESTTLAYGLLTTQ